MAWDEFAQPALCHRTFAGAAQSQRIDEREKSI
jgi:hypothetical protein